LIFWSIIAHVALYRLDGLLWVLDRLVLRGLAHELLAIRERDNRGCRPFSLAVYDNLRLSTFHDRERAVRGPKVDSENLVARHVIRNYPFAPVKSC
jgi:hypothetical protein